MMPFFAAILPAIIVMCGLALDTSMLELKKIQMQNAADAAAIGAELELERDGQNVTTVGGTTTYNYILAAQEEAAQNGFTNGLNNVSISVVNDPTYGEYAGRYDGIQVAITAPVPTYFLGVLKGRTTTPITAYATSLEPPCNYAMNTNNAVDSVVLTASNIASTCPMYAQGGILVDGTSYLNAVATDITGNPGGSTVLGRITPNPSYKIPAVPDPLAGVTSPAFTACTPGDSGLNIVGGASLKQAYLTPGTYCGGITSSTGQLNFSPGLYIITGGINWYDTLAVGSGVTLFFTKGGGSGYGTVNIAGNSSILLSAPSDNSNGGIPGIVFFLDRNWTPALPAGFQANDVFFVGDGIYYSINTGMNFTLCSNYPTNYFGMVTDNLTFNQTVYTATFGLTFYSNYSNLSTGNPFRTRAVLVQ